MSDISLTVGDTLPSVNAILLDSTNSPFNLTGATVEFVVHKMGSQEKVIDSPAEISDAAEGEVTYEWSSGDTSKSGYFEGKFRVTFAASSDDPEVQHFPDEGSVTIEIDDR